MNLKKLLKSIKRSIVKREPTSKISKTLIVAMYCIGLKGIGRYRGRKKSVMNIIEENVADDFPNRNRELKRLYKEIMYCRFMYGISAKEYFVFDFEKLSHKGRKTFLTRGNKYKFYKQFNNPNYTGYFNQKTETYRKFAKFYNRDVLCMYDEEDYDKFVAFVEKHPRFIYKPADDYGGNGIEIYDSKEYDSIKDLFEIIMFNGFCVVEELIVQGHEIAQFHPESVNTIRMVAFLTPSGETKIQWCFLRMGMGGSHTDNMSSGGLAAMIDPETGIIYTTGRDWKGDIHIYHPDTGVQLVGFQIPEWETLRKLVEEISHVLPEVRLVGWDFAYSDKGWTFVEGNSRPQCVSAQITEHNGKLHLYENMREIYIEETNRESDEESDDE